MIFGEDRTNCTRGAYVVPHSPDNVLSFGAACAIQTEMAGDVLADARSGKNGRHALAGLFR
jgi:hypothetical protein